MKKCKLIIVFSVILLFCSTLILQGETKTDSLLNVLQKEKNDTAKTRLYYLITKSLITSYVDSAKHFAGLGLKNALKNRQELYEGKFYSSYGDIYVIKNDLFSAMDNYIKALEIYKKKEYYTGMSIIYLLTGNIYYTQGNIYLALENFRKGLTIADSLHFERPLPYLYNNIGELNIALGNYDKAIESSRKSYELNKKNNDELGAASSLINISKAYNLKGDKKSAIEYLDKAFEIYSKKSDNLGMVKVYSTKGDIERKAKNYSEALKDYFKSLKYLDELGAGYFGPKSKLYADIYSNIGMCYLESGKYDEAEKFLFKSKEIAEEMGLLEILANDMKNISSLYEITGHPDKALKYYKIFKTYSDSIEKDRSAKEITKVEMQYKFDKLMREREVKELKYREKQRKKEVFYLVVIGGTVVLLIVFALLLNTQRLKRKNLNLEKEKLANDLEYKNKELTTNVLYLLKKNELIINLSNKLKNARYSFKPENRKIIDSIIRDMEQSTSTDVWKEFELRFREVHSDFYDKLTKKYPDLSPNELKLSAFLRLNMTTKEISSITFQSYNSIIMARHRLRKKLGIDTNENLIAFLRNL